MQKLTRNDLYSLEEYADARAEFRSKVIQHKKDRRVAIGEHAALYFEDRLTMQYQIQEMLRVERIFESAGINEELNAYNPLIPDGANLKATFMMEYADENERHRQLARLVGIEDKIWIRVGTMDKVYPIADEDMERDNETKTSSVHFLRFEFEPEMIKELQAGKPMAIGIEHKNYTFEIDPVAENVRKSLVGDFG